MKTNTGRIEKDSMGEMQVPMDALYGAQTRRAQLNFPVSGWVMPIPLVHSLARIKHAAAQVNCELGRLDKKIADWIRDAATSVMDGTLDSQFVIDVFQTGSGTSTNMNANEVIANRAIQLAGGVVGSRDPVHPNDHVNMGQSSNDVIPSAFHVAVAEAVNRDLLPAMNILEETLYRKAKKFDKIVKIGRTHLQDATPIRLGQVFSGYAMQVRKAERRISEAMSGIYELPIGGTAVGTGINTHPEFGARVCAALARDTGLPFREAENHFEAHANRDAAVFLAAGLKSFAVSLTKIANDIRLLGSGPRCGIGELKLPAIQPGSSIMPGKVNPVICESVMQVCSYVVGADATISYAAAVLSNFELCVAIPVIARSLLESIRLMSNSCRTFVSNCLEDLEPDEEVCSGLIEESLAMCTSLAPLIGYDSAAAIAKEAYRDGCTVREVALAKGVLTEDELDAALDPSSMTEPS
ncbi:MAG: class II fumarate hydratase [Planctomycetes bacterium]|nr:class II fumarate hydratase [Planctomycetota bacterium]